MSIDRFNETDNRGLDVVAKSLEYLYTTTDMPAKHSKVGAPALNVSLQASGKSRADLWAFAAMVAVKFGIDNNNKACKGQKA